LPMIFSVYLQVGDLGRSLSFYRDGLGLEVIWNDDAFAVLRGPGESAATLAIREVSGGTKPGLGQTGVARIGWQVTNSADLDSAEERLAGHGVQYRRADAMEGGKIIKWLKKEGDRINGGDILAEVETDKADVEMEAFGAGVLRKILIPAGESAHIGALIGVIAEPGDDITALVASAAAGGAGAGSGAQKTPLRPEPAPAPPATAASAVPSAPRQAVATPSAPSSPASRPVLVGAQASTGSGVGQGQAAVSAPAAIGAGVAPTPGAAAAVPAGGRVKASPLAKKIAAQTGVDLRLIQGSGPGGRIIRRDVEGAGAGAAPAAAVAAVSGAEFEDVPLSQMRAVPSVAAFAACPVAIVPPAPAMFSTKKVPPSPSASFCARMRAMTSFGPPGG